MRNDEYRLMEDYMRQNVDDSAHDPEHIYRVLYVALDIAQTEADVDTDVLIAACLLHDIGRKEQFENPKLCHAQVGAEKAYRFLRGAGYPDGYAMRVRDCIRSHRFRSGCPPEKVEEKILFDADKIDATGALGIARTVFYKGQAGEPLYTVDESGEVLDGSQDRQPSFFQEYKGKLEGLYGSFYTKRAAEIAMERRQAAVSFYNAMLREVQASHRAGRELLSRKIEG